MTRPRSSRRRCCARGCTPSAAPGSPSPRSRPGPSSPPNRCSPPARSSRSASDPRAATCARSRRTSPRGRVPPSEGRGWPPARSRRRRPGTDPRPVVAETGSSWDPTMLGDRPLVLPRPSGRPRTSRRPLRRAPRASVPPSDTGHTRRPPAGRGRRVPHARRWPSRRLLDDVALPTIARLDGVPVRVPTPLVRAG